MTQKSDVKFEEKLTLPEHLKVSKLIFCDCQQITFVKLNGLCPLNKYSLSPIPAAPSLFLTGNIKMDRMPTKVK